MDAENRSEESVMDFLTPLLAQFDKIYYDLAKRHGEFPNCVLCASWFGGNKAQ